MSTAAVAPIAPVAPAIPDILHEHFEELGFLAIQRRHLLFSEAPLRALRRLDERIVAHRDGLAVAGAEAVAMADTLLAADDPWLRAAAVRVWIEQNTGDPAPMRVRIEGVEPQHAPSWREALRCVDDAALERLLPATLMPANTLLLALAVDARGYRGALPPALAQAAATHAAPEVRAALARHARDAAAATALLDDPEVLVRRHALWSLVRADATAARSRARRDTAGAAPDPFSLRVLGLTGERADGDRLLALAAEDALAPAALAALRDLAEPSHADALLALLDAKDEAKATGARAAFESLLGPVPDPDPARPLPEGVTPEAAHVREQAVDRKRDARRLLGVPFPWAGEEADTPLGFLWRAALMSPGSAQAWLRREVPDGFFADGPDIEVLPGI